MADTTSSPTKPTGKTVNFNLIGDDLFLYETVKGIYEDEADEDESAVSEALESLDPRVRALVQARFAPVRQEKLSYRAVFVRALQEVLDARDAAADEEEAAEADEPEDSDQPAAVADESTE